MNDLRRHWLVWLAPEFRSMVSEQVANPMLRQVVGDFLAADWPLVIPSQACGSAGHSLRSTSIAVGMPLPPSQGKHRLAFKVPPESIVRAAPPLKLADAILGLTKQWRAPLQQLLDEADAIGLEFHVFGSVAWESLTGRGYLTSESDIDLLWRPADCAQIGAAIALLTTWETKTGLKVDGEIVLNDDIGVSKFFARQFSALADLFTIFILYLIVSKLYGRRIGLFAATFSTFAVLQIQQSHFFTSDLFTNLFMFLAIMFAVGIVENRELGPNAHKFLMSLDPAKNRYLRPQAAMDELGFNGKAYG